MDCFGACAQALHAQEVSVAVRIFAIKSIRGYGFVVDYRFLTAIDNSRCVVFADSIIKGIVKLTPLAKEECLVLLLETLGLAIKVSCILKDRLISKLLHKIMNG